VESDCEDNSTLISILNHSVSRPFVALEDLNATALRDSEFSHSSGESHTLVDLGFGRAIFGGE
jgi:hypothetical protein